LVITASLREFPSEYNMPEEQIRDNCTSCQPQIFNSPALGVIAEIRRREADSKSRTPIIGMSGSDLAAECLNAGADGFLRKPIVVERLFSTLDRMLT
jgi:CheY-like chemotaxis protein